jgi:hypothetical protein
MRQARIQRDDLATQRLGRQQLGNSFTLMLMRSNRLLRYHASIMMPHETDQQGALAMCTCAPHVFPIHCIAL